MGREWRNWTGDQRCRPRVVERPTNREELVAAIERAAERGSRVRVAAAGHSFTDIALTDDTMLRLEGLHRVLDVDRESGLVKVEGGITIRALNEALHSHGLALENLGDIDRQTIAGAISTATHGTGAALPNISGQVEAIELVLGDGSVRELGRGDGDLRAARVGLGALGAIASVTLRAVPAFTLRRIDAPAPLAEVLDGLGELAAAHDHFELFTFPHTGTALTISRDRVQEEPRPRGRVSAYVNEIVLENYAMDALSRVGRRFPRALPRLSRLASAQLTRSERVDRGYRLFASERRIRFTEMEYAIPRGNGAEAIRRVVAVAERPELRVGFPIEVRVVAGDDAYLSPTYKQDSCYIAVHQYRGVPWEPYFRTVEAIMSEYGGRPHWGKRHFQTAETLAWRYRRWGDFKAVRDRLDPERRFANAYTDRVLGP
jgi:L-gulono-1,4-lactone dehydrogenase